MKLKDKASGDFVVGQVWARVGSKFWLVDQIRGQWNQPTVRTAIALLAVRWPMVMRHVIENTGNGPEVIEQLRKADPTPRVSDEIAGLLGITKVERVAVEARLGRGLAGIVPEDPKGSKMSRLRAYSGLIEAGDVILAPRNAAWIPLLIDEAAAFPNGSHDDMIDSLSQALKYLSNGPASIEAPTGSVPRTPHSSPRITRRRSSS